VGPGGGVVRVGDGFGVVWEPEGAATVIVYRVTDDSLLVQREWGDDVGTPPVAEDADTIGELDVITGGLVILWSPASWDDLFDVPAPEGEGILSMLSMSGIGIQIQLPAGAYRCAVKYLDEAYRCWVTR